MTPEPGKPGQPGEDPIGRQGGRGGEGGAGGSGTPEGQGGKGGAGGFGEDMRGKTGERGPRGFASDHRFRMAITAWLIVFSGIVIFSLSNIHNQNRKIQQERSDAILRSCVDQNKHHDDAIIALRNLLIKSGVAKNKRQAAAEPATTLIDALSPRQNCDKLVSTSTSTSVRSGG
jgi:hypothetical protein